MHSLSLSLSLSVLLSVLAVAAYAADSTSFNPTAVTVKAQPSGGVPVGTVVAWPVASQPADADNWLDCDGRSTAGYPELAAVVGANVPNYQGLFLRGYGSQSHIKNNGSATGGNTSTTHQSGSLGAIQGDAIRNITGGFLSQAWIYERNEVGSVFYRTLFQYYPHVINSNTYGIENWTNTFDASRVTPTASEIRPVNKAVRYLIRARP